MTDELKQWEYDKGYTKGYSDGRASLNKELEKIKKKIKKIYDDEYLSNWITTKTLNVIDKRIAELKGEAKDEINNM